MQASASTKNWRCLFLAFIWLCIKLRFEPSNYSLTKYLNYMPGQILLTDELLRGWPLPQPREGGDREGRGRVWVVGVSVEMPGAAFLAATAALRAGAGKLRIATIKGIAPFVASLVPESRV